MKLRDCHAHVRAGQEAERTGRSADARRHFEAALRALTETEAGSLAANLLRWIAWNHTNEGDPRAALDCLEAAEWVATSAGDDVALASVLNTRAGTLFSLGELDDAEEIFERVRLLAVGIGDRKLQAIADQNLGTVSSIRGDAEMALGRFKSSLVNFEALGEMSYVGPLLNNIGRLQSELAEDEAARESLERARALCEVQGDRHNLIIVDVNRARLMLRADNPREALRTVEKARVVAETNGDDRWVGEVLLVAGTAHGRLGNPEVALNFLERALDVGRRREDPKLIADTALEQAANLRVMGRNRETLLRLTEARQLFERLRAKLGLRDVDQQVEDLEAAFLQIVRDWGESIESKDAYTQGHCSRVAEYACMLAEEADYGADAMLWFRMGALLHDVGKVSVPLEVLTKAGKLDDDEWAVMSRHPVFGVELLEGIEFPWDVKPMIRHHHERWDGSGYPDRIGGEEIPFEARILTIADIYDALTTTRSYRKAFSHDKAMAILRSEVGQTVDPDLFALFDDRVAPNLTADQPVFAAAIAS